MLALLLLILLLEAEAEVVAAAEAAVVRWELVRRRVEGSGFGSEVACLTMAGFTKATSCGGFWEDADAGAGAGCG